MRASALLLLLGACAQESSREAEPVALAVPCRLDGKAEECGVARTTDGRGTLVTVTHPDGGFRRLTIGSDGAITAADGAAAAHVSAASNGTLEVAVDNDRYSLPAR